MTSTNSWQQLSHDSMGQAFVIVPLFGAGGHRSHLRPNCRSWSCSAGRMWSEWDDHYLKQVRQWESDSSEAKPGSRGRVNAGASESGGRPDESTPGGNRYHASYSGGPWGFSVTRGGADDWKGGCFEWKGWQLSGASGRDGKERSPGRSSLNIVDVIGDHYRVLGVPRFASEEQVRRGYRLMAKRWHPDTFADESKNVHSRVGRMTAAEANLRFIRVQEAMEVLGDPKKRRIYDREFENRPDNDEMDRSYGSPAANKKQGNTADTRNTPPLGETVLDNFNICNWQTGLH